MMDERKSPTHRAYTLKRETRAVSRYIEIGHAHIRRVGDNAEDDQGDNVHHIFIDRLPVGGFTGHIFLSPVDQKPPNPPTAPERPERAMANRGDFDQE